MSNKSIIKLYLDQETIEKLCRDNPEIKVELEQATLKWVKQSVIKPLVEAEAAKYINMVKADLKEMIAKIINEDVFEVKYWHNRFDQNSYVKKLSDAAAKFIVAELKDTCETEFRTALYDRRDKALADFQTRLERNLSDEVIETTLRKEMQSRLGDIVKRMVDQK